ncbi:oxygenase MpaB family protein [Streptomyces sp. NPDC050703]|uniref:oxygenase MpaB family protein n=1 Tax=Streptomyces sp. NPDC050703 TaxID=3157218 RepID=UPI0034266E10
MPLSHAEAIYRHLVRHDLCEDLAFGLNIGFYRTFAVPEIAKVLVSTGKMNAQTELRAMTTGLMMHQLFYYGLDSEKGARTVQALNRIHARWEIGNETYLYVLACFDIAPIRWCDANAWRATTAEEKDACHTFYCGLAERMGIRHVPPTWDEFAIWTDRYEEERFDATPESAQLWVATRGFLISRCFSAKLAPLFRGASDAFLDEPLRRAFGVARPHAAARTLAAISIRLRARRIHRAHSAPDYQPVLPPAVRDFA